MKTKSFLLLLVVILIAAGFLLMMPTLKQKPIKKSADAEAVFRHRNLGLAYLEEMRLTEADGQFRDLIKLAPDQSIGYGNLALVYLRSGKFKEAEDQARIAVQKDSSNPDASLILAEIYEQSGKFAEGIQLMEKTVRSNPDHFRSRYKLIQLLLRNSTDSVTIISHLQKLSGQQPGNLALQLQYLEVLVREGKKEEAIKKLQLIRQQLPELQGPGKELLQKTIDALLHNSGEAITSAVMLHNVLKPSEIYRAGITELKGPGAPMIGFPLLFFDPAFQKNLLRTAGTTTIPMRFEETKLPDIAPGTIAFIDYDLDGDQDLFSAGRLYKNEKGKFAEQFNFGKIDATFAIFLDYDNDGHLDLYLCGKDFQAMFRNDGNGKWQDVTKQLHLPENIGGARALVLDFDQDGDLDLFKIGSGKNAAYRNNGDGTFEERSEAMGLEGESQDGTFFDFDEDGDLDLILCNQQSLKIFSNLREARFQDVTSAVLQKSMPAMKIVAADIDNNGYLDLLTLSRNKFALYRNLNGKFERVEGSSIGITSASDAKKVTAADFDNDGHVDVLMIDKTPLLFHNMGDGKFKKTSFFPQGLPEVQNSVVADFDTDGDLDLVVADQSQITLLKNLGGNANHWLNVSLKGLGTGSGKNNRFGIGAAVEVLAGQLYQKQVATEQVVHFGLGDNKASDVVRVVWTNGVPQNRVLARANQTIVEEQILKGSCAFLYAWNGTKFDFVTDVLWRSALGMPLGIMGGSTTYAFADASQEYIKISSKQLQPRNGNLSLRITEELWETPYLDQVTLTAVDHPPGTEVFVDEKFIPPPFPPLHIYMVSNRTIPRTALNERGHDMLPYIREKDDSYTPNLIPAKFQGITTMHDLILEPGPISDPNRMLLFLNGWIFPSDASINTGLSQGKSERAVPPTLEVLDNNGNWKQVAVIGFPGGKDKTVVVDLHGKLNSPIAKIRIRSSMEVYWDHVFFAEELRTESLKQTELKPTASELRYRGFSKMYRKGIYGPQWFDYNIVSKDPLWRDLAGNYTKFGDVNPLLLEADSKSVIFNAGDEIAVEFDTKNLPNLPQGWTRDYLIFTIGWLKDGDLNTATSSTVEPLPFHGMTKYPYGNEQSYPQDQDHQQYLRMYNTRKVEHKLKQLSK